MQPGRPGPLAPTLLPGGPVFRRLSWEGEGTCPASGAGPAVPGGGPSEVWHLGAKTRAGPRADLQVPVPSRALSSVERPVTPPALGGRPCPGGPSRGPVPPTYTQGTPRGGGVQSSPQASPALPPSCAPWPPNPGLTNRHPPNSPNPNLEPHPEGVR